MRRTHLPTLMIVCLPLLLATACDDDEGETACDPLDDTTCPGNSVCEETTFGEPACFAPVQIRGNVFDSLDESPIEGATVVSLDINGFAISSVVQTDEHGDYALAVPVSRTEDGTPVDDSATLRVDAEAYQTFPTAPRTALPIDLSTATDPDPSDDDDALVVQNAATDVAMIPLAGNTSGLGVVRGHVDHDDAGGVLIVAEQGNRAVSTAVTDIEGKFTVFNVPPGSTLFDGYRAGLDVTEKTVDVASGDNDDVVLEATTAGLVDVSGTIQIVETENVPTSVILGVESTFDEEAIRARAPAGLRAGDITGAFTIPDVPPGNYVVLAAYENDGLVRDPDEGISGTDIVHITVLGDEPTMTLEESFKITKALDIVSPGADGLEIITDANPTFVWSDDSGEEGYELRVFNAYGDMIDDDTAVPRVTGGATASYDWTPTEPLEDGMVYQFRVVSFDDTNDGRQYMSATEDLKGVFMYQAAQ